MAASNFQTQKPLSVLLAISITFFLLLLNQVSSSKEISFSFTKFGQNQQNLILQRDANVTSTGVLQLTKVNNGKPIPYSLGRALYAGPVRIFDKAKDSAADFNTSFSFVLKAPDATATADGIAFFLAPLDTQPQAPGGYLGLFNDRYYNSSNQIVAVEFDTYSNPWDPSFRHIGIDVNTIESTKTVSWGWRNGEVANVLISYRDSTKILSASLTYPSSQSSYFIQASVDLKSVLPEWVRVGFSATTGQGSGVSVETHDVLSWSFSCSLHTSNGTVAEENNAHLASATYAA